MPAVRPVAVADGIAGMFRNFSVFRDATIGTSQVYFLDIAPCPAHVSKSAS